MFTADSTIIAGADYVPISVEIEFNSSVEMQCMDIQVIDDTTLETDEVFFITLEVSDPDVILENHTATIIIGNNDRMLHVTLLCSITFML